MVCLKEDGRGLVTLDRTSRRCRSALVAVWWCCRDQLEAVNAVKRSSKSLLVFVGIRAPGDMLDLRELAASRHQDCRLICSLSQPFN